MNETELSEIDAKLAAADAKLKTARTGGIDVIDGVARTVINIARRLRDAVTADRAEAVERAARIVEGAAEEIGAAAAASLASKVRALGGAQKKRAKTSSRRRSAGR